VTYAFVDGFPPCVVFVYPVTRFFGTTVTVPSDVLTIENASTEIFGESAIGGVEGTRR